MTDHKTAEAVLKKYDRESNTAHYTGLPQKIIALQQLYISSSRTVSYLS